MKDEGLHIAFEKSGAFELKNVKEPKPKVQYQRASLHEGPVATIGRASMYNVWKSATSTTSSTVKEVKMASVFVIKRQLLRKLDGSFLLNRGLAGWPLEGARCSSR